jgi:hypothetical protein
MDRRAIIMIRLKDNFQKGRALSQISADWLNTVARWLNGMEMQNGVVDRYPDRMKLTLFGITGGGGGESTDFAWNVIGTGLTLTVTPGDIELGPDTVIEWASITGASTTVSATTGDTTLWIWVNVDVENETAEMFSGTSITTLDSTERKTIYQKRIAKVTLVDDAVTAIARYQCGNIAIPRL